MKNNYQQIKEAIRKVDTHSFEAVALEVFEYQKQNNPLYQEFINLLGLSNKNIQQIEDIPFLPIQFFKSKQIKTGQWTTSHVFSSSGTTQTTTSTHHLKSAEWYRENSCRFFEQQYGPLENYIVLALLPSYLERKGSSLIFMIDAFIKNSKHPLSGFFLYNTQQLKEVLSLSSKENRNILLVGVSYALLDLIQDYDLQLERLVVMETGGMKGRRKEMTKEQLHTTLKKGFKQTSIHSEYGMTELLSQAYSKKDVGGKGMYGDHVHRAVYGAMQDGSVTETGMTLHWVDAGYDTGAVFFQARVELDASADTPLSISAKVRKLELEHCAQEALRAVTESLSLSGTIDPQVNGKHGL